MAEKAFLYEQIGERLQFLIRDGELKPGDRVPSLRHMSRTLGVSLTSVTRAYEILEDQGVIESQPKSGYFVRLTPCALPETPEFEPLQPAECLVNKNALITSFQHSLQGQAKYTFGCASPHPSLLPAQKLNRLLANSFRDEPTKMIDYTFPPGLEKLRRQIAVRALDTNCTFSYRDVVITGGCMEALNLSLRVLTKPGDAVLIEAPTYMGHLQSLENLNLRAVPVPICPNTGLDPDLFEETLSRCPVKACILTPTFNNPTGALMSNTNKQRIVEIAYRHNVPIIEDDVYGELAHTNERPLPLKSWDQHSNVLYCSSFSKSLSPGLRIGWVANELYKEKISNLQFMSTVSVASPSQYAVAEYLSGGHFQRHLKNLRHHGKSSMSRAAEVVARAFPKGTKVTFPQGGFLLWLELPETIDSLELYREALSRNISFAPGPLFGVIEGAYRNYIRLNVAQPWSSQMESLLEALGKLAKSLV